MGGILLNEEKEEESSGRNVHSMREEFRESKTGSVAKRKDEGTVWLEEIELKKVLRNALKEIYSGQFTALGLTQ